MRPSQEQRRRVHVPCCSQWVRAGEISGSSAVDILAAGLMQNRGRWNTNRSRLFTTTAIDLRQPAEAAFRAGDTSHRPARGRHRIPGNQALAHLPGTRRYSPRPDGTSEHQHYYETVPRSADLPGLSASHSVPLKLSVAAASGYLCITRPEAALRRAANSPIAAPKATRRPRPLC